MDLKRIIILALLIRIATSLIGYDCGAPTLNVTTISLNNIGGCDIPLIDPTPIPVRIQLLQLSEFSATEVIQCKIEVDRTLYYCGMNSHNSIVQNGRQIYLTELDDKSCRKIHETGIIQLGISAIVTGIKRNSTTSRSITLAGTLTNEGACTGAQYSDPFGTWTNVVVQAAVKITISNYQASVNMATDRVILQSTSQCQLSEGSCTDVEGNQAFWRTEPVDTCLFNRYDVLYDGMATKLRTIENSIQTPDVYTLTTQETTFALAVRSEKPICGYTLIRTEHPKLFILETRDGQTFASRRKVLVSNLDIFSYVNSKFIYVEKHLKSQIKALYKDVLTQRCNLEQQVLRNALATAAILPEKFARAVTKSPGYMAVIAGEVAHIVKCIPVECTLRRTEECYLELPVMHKNQTFFLSTNSRTLIKAGTHIECNPLLPAQYLIDGAWYRFAPHPIEVPPPQLLRPMTTPTWGYSPVGNLASSGIYTNEEIEQLRDRIMFPAERPALLNNLARGSAGYTIPPGSVSLKNLLDENTLEHITSTAFAKLWNGFEKFGIISAGFFGIIAIYSIIKSVIDTIIHGYTLHSLYGCSFALIGAIWNSVTNLLIARAHKKNRQTGSEDGTTPRELMPEENPEPQPTASYTRRLSGVDAVLLERLRAHPQQSSGVASS